MRKVRLTKEEREIEKALLRGEYIDIDKNELTKIAQAIANRKKDTVLNIRINSKDLMLLKNKAKRFGVRYQTFISELLHKVAHS